MIFLTKVTENHLVKKVPQNQEIDPSEMSQQSTIFGFRPADFLERKKDWLSCCQLGAFLIRERPSLIISQYAL